jgi:hypothetical protein
LFSRLASVRPWKVAYPATLRMTEQETAMPMEVCVTHVHVRSVLCCAASELNTTMEEWWHTKAKQMAPRAGKKRGAKNSMVSSGEPGAGRAAPGGEVPARTRTTTTTVATARRDTPEVREREDMFRTRERGSSTNTAALRMTPARTQLLTDSWPDHTAATTEMSSARIMVYVSSPPKAKMNMAATTAMKPRLPKALRARAS